jgi:putative transposase
MYYRRSRIEGGTFFFTVVTFNREKILASGEVVDKLRKAFIKVREGHPFEIEAAVVLPDHIHCIWTLPEGDYDFSNRWRLVKSYFTRSMDSPARLPSDISRTLKKEQTLWQRRFWEHSIRDDNDFIRHVEYIHYNPVKHGLVSAPYTWPYSSFHRFVQKGFYQSDWGSAEEIQFDGTIGME